MNWAIIYLRSERKFRYVQVKFIKNFDAEKFLLDEKAGAAWLYDYESSDGKVKHCQVMMVGGTENFYSFLNNTDIYR